MTQTSENLGDRHYSKRELDLQFATIGEKLDSFEKKFDGRLDTIDQKVSKTNGSVASLKGWRFWTTGAMAVVIFAVIPLVIYIFNLQTQFLQQQITSQLITTK